MKGIFTAFILSFLLISCADASVKHYRLEIVAEYPHDTESYTQGLFFHDGQMYETTGLNGKSTLRKVDIQTGKPVERIDFDSGKSIGNFKALTASLQEAGAPNVTVTVFGELIELPTRQNTEKATAFAEKYGLELPNEPFETNIIWRK